MKHTQPAQDITNEHSGEIPATELVASSTIKSAFSDNSDPSVGSKEGIRYRRLALSVLLGFVLGAIFSNGCSTTSDSSEQLARVAKDWCLTIRASQVIPVYPLTEDLEPGDVFLVQSPIEQQVAVFKTNNFLPFENLLTRLHPTNYEAFYQNSYSIASNSVPPMVWRFPSAAYGSNIWERAPHAGFPSYKFSVTKGGGLNLAVPVEGVPVGLNLLGTAEAQGDITIADAYTYGLDILSIRRLLDAWAENESNTNYLAFFAATDDHTNYLRVVNRVYLTGRVNVSLFADRAFSGSLSGGADKEVDLPKVTSHEAASNYVALNTKLAAAMQAALEAGSAALPGGKLKVAAASSRSVTLSETFTRPLVIGYMAYDIPINSEGKLGSFLPTQARLKGLVLHGTRQEERQAQNVAEITEHVRKGNRVDTRKWQQLLNDSNAVSLSFSKSGKNWEKYGADRINTLQSELLEHQHQKDTQELVERIQKMKSPASD